MLYPESLIKRDFENKRKANKKRIEKSMSDWKEYKLGDLYDVHNGLSKGRKFFGSGYPFLSFKTVFNNYFLPPKLSELVQANEKEQKGYNIKRGDVFVTRTSETPEELGMSSVALKDYPFATYNGFTKRLRPKDMSLVCPEFIGYYLRSPKFRALFYGLASSMSTRASLVNGDLLGMSVFLPSFETQERIASLLSSLDDKISVNKKICENLEAQAQALFKHWFIDFAPFKDGKFVESELGMIPEGLIYQRIKDMPHTLETGKRPAGGVKGIDSGVPSIGAENIKGLGCYDYSKTKYVTEEFAASIKKGIIKGYELLIYKDGGKPGYFIPSFAIFGEGYPFEKMCLNEHVFKLDFGNRGYSLFAYFLFKSKRILSYLNAQGAKAAIPGINSKDVEAIIMPSLYNKSVQDYCKKVEDIIIQILVLSKESSRLSTLRDTLLPRLMSGQIKL